MAAQVLFKMACPSCDAQVPIRDSGLVGRKVACPNCKYPFVVENPDGFEPLDEGPKGKKKSRRDDDDEAPRQLKKKKSGNGPLMIGLGVGGVAVVVLAVAGYFLFLKGDEPKPRTTQPVAANKGNPPATTSDNTATPNNDQKTPENPPTEVAKNDEPAKPGEPVAVGHSPWVPPAAASSGNITNLLPNDSQSVTFINVDKFHFSTIGEQVFESKVGLRPDAFKTKLGIDIGEMMHFVRGENVEQKWAFNVLRTSKPIKIQDLEKALGFKKASKSPIKGRVYYELPPNELLDNLSAALLSEAELRERRARKKDESQTLGLLHLDESTIVIAQLEVLEDFMKIDCKPRHQSKPIKGPADPNQPGAPPSPSAPPKPGARPGTGGMSASVNMAMMMLQEPGSETPLTDNDTFLTIDPPLKAMFDRLDNDPKNPPIIIQCTLAQADPKLLQRIAGTGVPLPQMPNAKVVGMMLTKYELEKFYATVAIEFFNENDVKQLEVGLKKALTLFARFLSAYLGGVKVEVEGGENAPGPGAGGGGGAPGGGGGRGSTATEGPPGTGGGGLPGPPVIEGGPVSKLKLARKGRVLIGTAELNLIQRGYDQIYRITEAMVARVRGMVDMASPVPMWKDLAAAAVKLHEGGSIPRATFPRDETKGGRLAPNWPPQHRVSWMAGLLPHLGHDDLYRSIKRDKNWRDESNLKAGSLIVPAFLDPRYPEPAWYARIDSLGARAQGATHYVGIAGVGLDAADYKSDDPAQAKKMGAFNYDKPTNIKDVTDGLSTSIYMIQVPPNYQRPWIAGGGATVVGVPETKAIRPFVATAQDGKKGTYVVMLDGSVRFIGESISDEVFKALCTIRGGESIEDIEAVAPKAKLPKGPELKTTAKAE